jgi:hypothetical protein
MKVTIKHTSAIKIHTGLDCAGTLSNTRSVVAEQALPQNMLEKKNASLLTEVPFASATGYPRRWFVRAVDGASTTTSLL